MNTKLIDIQLDASIGKSTPDIEHERAVAIEALLHQRVVDAAYGIHVFVSLTGRQSNELTVVLSQRVLQSV